LAHCSTWYFYVASVAAKKIEVTKDGKKDYAASIAFVA
jgi:hypothetical protein